MSKPLLCPSCKTNRTRFNRIEQVAQPIRYDGATGTPLEGYEPEMAMIDPFHSVKYNGPEYLLQCATCGNIESPYVYEKTAEVHRKNG